MREKPPERRLSLKCAVNGQWLGFDVEPGDEGGTSLRDGMTDALPTKTHGERVKAQKSEGKSRGGG